MKKMILSFLIIAAATLSAWKPAEQSSATGNTNSVNEFSLLPVTPFASYGTFSATVSGFVNHTVTYSWTTTAETNVARFRVFRKDMSTSVVVTTDKNAQSSSFPRSYSYADNTVVNGTTYEYSVCAISADGTLGSGSEATSVMVPMSTR